MKNPFERKQSGAMLAGIILSSLAAGTIAYLFMTENGSDVREQFKAKLRGLTGELTGGPAEKHHEHIHHETAYQNKRKPKAKKSDKERILKHEILGHHDEPGETHQ